ncbi:MAG: hypothetical protein QF654_00180 [Alphaproteobacteria bacterium]|jgi:hypothetical protein|nr:hypothetical protein [Alphaproteobacteria bacterium]
MSWTTLDFAPMLPWPLLAGLGVLTVLTAGLILYARASGAWLRVAALAALMLALLNPALIEEQREPLRDVAVVVVDDTPSTATGKRRQQIEDALAGLEKRFEKMVDTLEVRIVRVRHDSIAAAGEGTRLFRPLREAFAGIPARRAAAVILLTDGQVHDAPKGGAEATLPAPLHVLLAGRPGEKDRRLVIVKAPKFGIVGSTIETTVRIEDASARKGGKTRLTVRRDGGPEKTIEVPIGVDHGIEFKLEHGGPSVFELSVAAGADELTLDNNRAVVSVNGVRDRLRVLLVSGEPHAGERTWRNLLKADPSVDLVHFTILRPPEKQDGTPINELSLISFPTRELFEVKLEDFDLVIFDRYRRRGVLPPVYLQNIVDYIRQGGALLEAVGPSFATPFSIYRTPLGKALPGEPTGKVFERAFRPEVTKLGLRHPVTATLPISPRARSGKAKWGRWFRQIEVEASRGRILMAGVENRPLLILDRFGEGRVAQLNSDHIWLWSRGFEGGGPHGELLRRVAHWLMKEPDLEENDLRATVRGDRLEIIRRSLRPDARPVELTGPDGKTRKIELAEDKGGRSKAELALDRAGLYRISDGQHVALVAAGALNPVEFADVRATANRLTAISQATGGGLHWLADGAPDVRRVRPGRATAGRDWIGLLKNGDYIVTGVERLTLLPTLMVLVLVLGAMALAWREEGR